MLRDDKSGARMLLIGVNRSPFTRRVAITLNIYGLPFEQRALSGFDNRAEVRASNPLGRIPALVLESGETLIDSNAIIDQVYGHDRPLTPPDGADRRGVLKVAATSATVPTFPTRTGPSCQIYNRLAKRRRSSPGACEWMNRIPSGKDRTGI
jgi:glutathione S-transferase